MASYSFQVLIVESKLCILINNLLVHVNSVLFLI